MFNLTSFEPQIAELKRLLEQAKLFMKIVDFDQAIEMLVCAHKQARDAQCWQSYLDSVILLIRIYSERLEIEKATDIAFEVFHLAQNNKIILSPRFYYVLGICQYNQGKYDLALNSFETGLAMAPKEDNALDFVNNLIGVANCYSEKEDLVSASRVAAEALERIESHQLTEIKPYLQVLRARLSAYRGNFQESKNILDSIRVNEHGNYNGYLSCMICFNYGELYLKWGHLDRAKTVLELACTLVDSKNLKSLSKALESLLSEVRQVLSERKDLEISFGNQIEIHELTLGKITFKDQHILGELLKLLADKMGCPQDKEEIVQKIWKCAYDPLVHDNKLYVTVKRLRQLIEPDPKKPVYLLRSRSGYYLNSDRKISIKTEGKVS